MDTSHRINTYNIVLIICFVVKYIDILDSCIIFGKLYNILVNFLILFVDQRVSTHNQYLYGRFHPL